VCCLAVCCWSRSHSSLSLSLLTSLETARLNSQKSRSQVSSTRLDSTRCQLDITFFLSNERKERRRENITLMDVLSRCLIDPLYSVAMAAAPLAHYRCWAKRTGTHTSPT